MRLARLRAAALRPARHHEEDAGVDKLDVYFNDDSGSGKFRGVPALGNAQLAAIFQSWIAPIKDLGIAAVMGLTAGPTTQPGGTDSTSFSWIGLNGIGFMQDPREYGRGPTTPTWTCMTACRRAT